MDKDMIRKLMAGLSIAGLVAAVSVAPPAGAAQTG
jgi:radical SAM modification target selenobiotic family peptide